MQYRDYADKILPQASNIILSLLLLALLFSDTFFVAQPNLIVESARAGFSPYFSEWLSSFDLHSHASVATSAFIVLVISFLMIWMNEIFSFIAVRTILPATFFLLTLSLLLRPHGFNVSYLIVLMAALILFSCFRMCESPYGDAPVRLFNIGMILGLQSLLSISMLTYVFVLVPFLYQVRTLSMRTVVAFLMGLFLPVLYSFIGVAVATFQETGVGTLSSVATYFHDWHLFGNYELLSQMSLASKCYLGCVLALTLFSAFQAFFSSATLTVKNRIEILFLTFNFLWTLFLMVIGVSDMVLLLPLLLFLGAFLLGFYFSSDYTLLIKILWGVFFVASILYYIFPNYNYAG